MPDETDIIISELTNAPQIDDTAVFPLTQDNGGSPATFKGSMSQIAGKIAEGTTYTNLNTTAKNLVGAINELADGGGGGSADIISEASGAIVTFNDGGDNIPVKSLVTEIVATQSGTGTPSPSNVRSISGFNAVALSVTGKNLFNKALPLGTGNITDDGSIGTASGYKHTVDYYPVLPNTEYTTSGQIATGNTRNAIACYDADKNFLVRLMPDSSGGWTFTTTATTAFIRMNLAGGSMDVDTVQLEQGDTATTYEPFGTTHTITLPETIYDGEADVANGTGVIEYGFVEFDGSSDEDWSYASGNKWATITISDMMSGANQDGITNWLSQSTTYGTFGFALGRNNNNFYAYQIPDISGVTDLASWKTYLSNNPLQVVYPLATPTAFTFTGENIPTLSGVNNVYADCGDIQSLEYFNDKADDFADLDRAIDYHNYSTVEHIVGKWIDGRPIYEKTIDFGTLPNNTIKGVVAGIATNLDYVVAIEGIGLNSNNNTFINIPYSATTGGIVDVWYDRIGQYGLADDCIVMNTKFDFTSYSAFVTIRYVKT